MESYECDKNDELCQLSNSGEDDSKVVHEIISDKLDDKVVQVNSKDDLNWVENEIVIVDCLNDKLATGFTSVGNSNHISEHSATETSCSSKETKCETVVSSNDDSETKLWEYFTEYNSSQLRCNLCKGLFLYQNDAAYLLKHIEVVHRVQVLVESSTAGSDCGLTDTENIKNSSIVPRSDIQQLLKSTENKVENADDSRVSATGINNFKLSDETEKLMKNSKVWRYFTRLETGKIRCNLCCRVLPYNSSESTVIRHLKSNHRDIYQYSVDSTNINVLKPNYDSSCGSKLSQKKSVNKIRTQSCAVKYFTRIEEAFDKMQCKFCDAVVKYAEGIDTNLIRHLKTKHKNVMDKDKGLCFSDSEKSPTMKNREKDSGSIIVLEIFEDGDDCLITNAQLQTENDQTVLTQLTNSVAIQSNRCNEINLSEGFESSCEYDLFENMNQIENEYEHVDEEMGKIMRHRDNIWDYFVRLTTVNDKARCNICSVILSCKNSEKKLFHHLAVKHGISYSKYYKSHNNKFDFEIDGSGTERQENKNSSVEYKITGELMVEDISNINLSSILYTEKGNQWIKSKKQSKCRQNIVGRMWKYYTKLYRGKVVCNLCRKSFIYKLGHITNLITHLKLKHKFIFKKINIKQRMENFNNRIDWNEAVKSGNKTDAIWKFFTKLDENKAECNLCEHMNVFYYSSSSQSNLMKHLHYKHKYFLDLNRSDQLQLLKNENAAGLIGNTNKTIVDGSQRGLDMKALFDYFSADKNLEKCIIFEKEQIVCKFCTGMFLFDDLLNFEYTIKYHVQTCHADTLVHNSTSVFSDNCLSDDELNLSEEVDEMSDSSSYNELEAISNEINNYGD